MIPFYSRDRPRLVKNLRRDRRETASGEYESCSESAFPAEALPSVPGNKIQGIVEYRIIFIYCVDSRGVKEIIIVVLESSSIK